MIVYLHGVFPMTSIQTPQFIRPNQAWRFGVSRTTIYNWINDGLIKTVVFRRPGKARGVRLISVESLKAYIESCPEK